MYRREGEGDGGEKGGKKGRKEGLIWDLGFGVGVWCGMGRWKVDRVVWLVAVEVGG